MRGSGPTGACQFVARHGESCLWMARDWRTFSLSRPSLKGRVGRAMGAVGVGEPSAMVKEVCEQLAVCGGGRMVGCEGIN
jgi:hypothetical protein